MKAKVCPECGHWDGAHHQNCPESIDEAMQDAEIDPDTGEDLASDEAEDTQS